MSLLMAEGVQRNTKEDIAASVFYCIALSLAKAISNAIKATGIKRVLLVGGVAASTLIHSIIKEKLKAFETAQLHICQPVYSTDNAFGTACLGIKHILESE